jgi:hypothetical protein
VKQQGHFCESFDDMRLQQIFAKDRSKAQLEFDQAFAKNAFIL